MATGAAVPTPAERVRTICARAGTARLAADGAAPVTSPVHRLLACGQVAITVPNGSAIAARPAGTPVVLELLDHAPVTAAESVRALVWIRGRMRPASPTEVRPILDAIAATDPNPALLDVGHRDRLLICAVDSAVLADATGANAVDRCALLDARPDPFCQVEAAWVQHLEQHHGELLERLRLHIPRGMRRGRLRLLGLDRYGLQVRVEGHQGSWDVRVPFFSPVADSEALGRALRSLMGCPFTRGLRGRTA